MMPTILLMKAMSKIRVAWKFDQFLSSCSTTDFCRVLPRNCFLIPLERAGGVQTRSSRSTPSASLSLSVCPLLLLLLLQVPQLLMSAAASKNLQLLVDVSTLPDLFWSAASVNQRTEPEMRKKTKTHNSTDRIQKLAFWKQKICQ
jgi:hypothetical protein